MSSTGITRRVARLQGPGGRFLLLALDHGLPAGPIRGIEDPAPVLRAVRDRVTGVIANPGLVPHLAADLGGCGLIVHLSAGTLLGSHPSSKVLSTTVDRAVSLGADAVSVQIHFGDPEEGRMLADAGEVADAAAARSLPCLVMALPPRAAGGPEACAHAVRAAAELRAQLVQTPHPGSPEAVRAAVRGCPVPVVLAGGPASPSPEAWLSAMADGLAAGAAGLSVGRSLFQHPDPGAFAARLHAAVFAGGHAASEGRLTP